jgi:tetratricopeptide (TPR) repeat protein
MFTASSQLCEPFGMGTDRGADAARLRQVLAANPQDRVSWHNLAAAEGDLGRAAEAEAAARRALALGIPAPETRLVLARALQDLNRLDEAERMFEEAVARRPTYPEAHRDLAQLRWMRTGAVDDALRALDDALHRAPRDVALHYVRAVALEFIGDKPGALASAEAGLALASNDLQLLRTASHLCAELGQGSRAVVFALRAVAAAPGLAPVQITLCEAHLAAGDIPQAEEVAARLCATNPLDQHAIAMRATAWRLLGDPRYESLYDYARFTHAESIDAPLEELALDLGALHRYRAHPFQQSVRGGGQLPLNAREMARPAIRALFDSFREVVERHLARVGPGADPFRSRNTGRFAFAGAWSVRLSSGGYHTDHVHQRGWLSSAFYVALPPVMKPESARAGWLRFGRPGIATRPELSPERHVQPEPGKLILFPSYMWHGVEPFESDAPRLTVAFDALPA